jgi:hypothetical protein
VEEEEEEEEEELYRAPKLLLHATHAESDGSTYSTS